MIKLKALFWTILKQEKKVKRRQQKKPKGGTHKVLSDEIPNTK